LNISPSQNTYYYSRSLTLYIIYINNLKENFVGYKKFKSNENLYEKEEKTQYYVFTNYDVDNLRYDMTSFYDRDSYQDEKNALYARAKQDPDLFFIMKDGYRYS
jgi:uncharacterized protein with gpF-like domain